MVSCNNDVKTEKLRSWQDASLKLETRLACLERQLLYQREGKRVNRGNDTSSPLCSSIPPSSPMCSLTTSPSSLYSSVSALESLGDLYLKRGVGHRQDNLQRAVLAFRRALRGTSRASCAAARLSLKLAHALHNRLDAHDGMLFASEESNDIVDWRRGTLDIHFLFSRADIPSGPVCFRKKKNTTDGNNDDDDEDDGNDDGDDDGCDRGSVKDGVEDEDEDEDEEEEEDEDEDEDEGGDRRGDDAQRVARAALRLALERVDAGLKAYTHAPWWCANEDDAYAYVTGWLVRGLLHEALYRNLDPRASEKGAPRRARRQAHVRECIYSLETALRLPAAGVTAAAARGAVLGNPTKRATDVHLLPPGCRDYYACALRHPRDGDGGEDHCDKAKRNGAAAIHDDNGIFFATGSHIPIATAEVCDKLALSTCELSGVQRLRASISLVRAYCAVDSDGNNDRDNYAMRRARTVFCDMEDAVGALLAVEDDASPHALLLHFGIDHCAAAERLACEIKSLHAVVKGRGHATSSPCVLC